MEKDLYWYVLFVQTGQEELLCELINDENVHCFSAKIEFYKRVTQTIELKSLFPGYVLCKSHFNQKQFDEWLRKKPVKKGLIKELKYDEQSPALLPEEIMILKRLLNHEGILKMSKGTKRNRKFHIVQGPLVDMDDYIIKYDSQHKLATLNLFFINQQWQAGVMEI